MTDASPSERLRATKRNDPCPCGSGRKYKKCHLEADEAAVHAEAQTVRAAAAKAAEEASEAEADSEAATGTKKEAGVGAERPAARHNKPARGAGQNPRPKNLPRRRAV